MENSYVFPSNESQPIEYPESIDSPNPIASTSKLPSIQTPKPSSPLTPLQPLTRKELIDRAIQDEDLKELQRLAAEPRGFERSEIRKTVWPVLLGCKSSKANGKEPESLIIEKDVQNDDVDKVELHRDEGQVRLDVIRSFVHYPNDISAEKKEVLRERLEKVIVSVLRRHPALRYFQGYHDIISVLLLTLDDDDLTLLVAEKMSLHRIRDSMGVGLEPVLGYLKLVHRILAKVDPELCDMVNLAASLPYFSLSWILTLMSHDLTSLDVVARLFDFLLANNPAMVSYFGVAIILLKKQELQELDEEDADDPAIIHHTLSKLPDIRLSPPSPPTSPSPSPSTPTPEEDEDLMSNNDDTASLSTSYLSESIISLSGGEEEEEGDSMDSYSIFSDEMLSDPDITGPAFSEFLPLDSFTSNTPPLPTPIITTSLNGSSTQGDNKPPFTRPIVFLDELILKTLELWERFPLDMIKAEEVLGPKSCISTWEESLSGKLSDEEADEIAKEGVDIVVQEKIGLIIKEVKEEDGLEEIVEGITSLKIIPPITKKLKKKETSRSRRRNAEIGIGAVLTLAGVAGVFLAIYGDNVVKEWDYKNFGSKINWKVGG